MKISPARVAAFDILLRIETERAFSSILLPQYESQLAERDRGLCHELTLGSLRRQIYLDRTIDHYAGGKKVDAAVRIAVRLAIYQLVFLDKIPDHSAVDESVKLVQRARKTSAKGFVNAILRRAATERIELPFDDDIDKLSVETSHPRWLLERWISHFGEQGTAELASANNRVDRHAFRVIGDGTPKLGDARPSEFVEGCYVVDKLDRNLIDLAARREIYFQDEASQMVANAVNIPEGGSFLDVCAAPGGKTGSILRRCGRTTKVAVAGDLFWTRVLGLRDNLEGQRVQDVGIVRYDAEMSLPFSDSAFDAVLVDAPCSGTGTIRRNPELRYFLEPADIPELAEKQLRILKNASKLVSHGGSMIYSTCSFESEENEDVCRRFLTAEDGFDHVAPRVPLRFLGTLGSARTFPDRDNMDGFFVAEFRRK